MKKITLICVMIVMFSCSKHAVRVVYPEKFEGLTQLVLASQTTTVTFTEDVSKRFLAVFRSHAQVRVQSSVTYDFYLDFEQDSYEAQLDKNKKLLRFNAPPIRVKKPVINQSTVSFPETGILVNENEEAVKILETLTDRFIQEGKHLLKQKRVMDKCEEKLQEYLLGLCRDLNYDVEGVEVLFRKEEVPGEETS